MAFIAQIGNFDPSSLGLLQRILLITDGTLTDTLEAAFLEPIGLRKIALDVDRARKPMDGLDLPEGAPVMERRIVLYGETSGRPYVYAHSRLALDRLPSRFREELLQSDTPMGRLWSEYRLETWKELLYVARRPAAELAPHLQIPPEAECLSRRYRVLSAGWPLMVIEEQFPLVF